MKIKKLLAFLILIMGIVESLLILVQVNHLELFLSFLTFLTILIALFKKDFLLILEQPSLTIICSKKDLYENENIVYSFLESWLGIRIVNKGETSAKNVRLYFNGISSNVLKDFKNYIGLPLRKGWTNGECIKNLSPNIPIRYDLCILSDMDRNRIDFTLKHTPQYLKEILCKKGKLSFFEFEIIAIADNSKPAKKKIRIEFYGDYNQNFSVKIKK